MAKKTNIAPASFARGTRQTGKVPAAPIKTGVRTIKGIGPAGIIQNTGFDNPKGKN